MNESGKVQLEFAKRNEQGLYSFLNLVRPAVTPDKPLTGLGVELYNYQFDCYLGLAGFLSDGLSRFVVIRSTPHVCSMLAEREMNPSLWRYQFIADDINGIGIDNGFVNISDDRDEEHCLANLDSLGLLKQMPEDSFGDNISQVSVFGLAQNRWTHLKDLLQQKEAPQLSSFLQTDEFFINMLVSKTEGFFHAMLIKSPSDIENKLNDFQNVIASDN